MSRNGCLLRKAEINQLVSFDSRRLAEINSQLNQLKNHANRKSRKTIRSTSNQCSNEVQSGGNGQLASIQVQTPDLPGWLCMENRALPITEIDVLQILPKHGLHIRTRQESSLISLPDELQSDELLRAITSGEVNCLLGSCEPYEPNPRNRATTAATACWNE